MTPPDFLHNEEGREGEVSKEIVQANCIFLKKYLEQAIKEKPLNENSKIRIKDDRLFQYYDVVFYFDGQGKILSFVSKETSRPDVFSATLSHGIAENSEGKKFDKIKHISFRGIGVKNSSAGRVLKETLAEYNKDETITN